MNDAGKRRLVLPGLFALVLAGTMWAGESPTAAPENLPLTVKDESAGDWVVDRLVGHSQAGPEFLQGPARETGGDNFGAVLPLPDGSVLFACESAGGLARLSPDGTVRLFIGGGGLLEGSPWQVRGGTPFYNPKDKMVYLTGPNCIRRVVEKEDGARRVEIVAGTPGKAGFTDGPVGTATFKNPHRLAINGRGTIYVLDADERLRRIEDGRVVTLNGAFKHCGYQDGPLAQARFTMTGLGGSMCLGDNDDILYIADHYNYCVRRIDLRAGVVTTVAGRPKPKEWDRKKQTAVEQRFNSNADGPALTHASFNSGCAWALWDPVHKTVWCGGPDEDGCRWLRPDGWVKFVIGGGNRFRWPQDAIGTPASQTFFAWGGVRAVDARGRAYISCAGTPNGIWRAYNRKEVKP